MGFVTRAEAEMDSGKEIERLNGVILSLDQTVDKQDREITDLQRQKAALLMEDIEEIETLRKERDQLQAKVKELEEKLASEIKWYAERLLGEASETSGQVRAYRDVIKILTGKDRDSCGCH